MIRSVLSGLLILASCLILAGQITPGALAQGTFKNPAMEPQDDAQQAFNRGRMLARQGRAGEAISEFQNAAKLRNGQCAECFYYIGQVNLHTGNHKEAAEAYRQAVNLKPENLPEMYNALGVALYLQDSKASLRESVTAFKQSIELGEGKIVKAYYNLGHALLKLGREEEGKAALQAYLEADPNSSNSAEVRALIGNPKLVGEKFAPAFKVTSTAGEQLSLEALRGKVVLIEFWATWCGPCLVEMPQTMRMWEKYRGDQFIIIGVSLDNNMKSLENYLKREGISWPQYYDESGTMSGLYNVRAIPQTFLIDQSGLIRAVGLRGGALSNKVGELLKQIPKQENASTN
jgi:tetratricopeptide (TPR) repeat protein